MAGQERTVENHDFPESSVFNSFQVANNALFSRENTRFGRKKRKYRPLYRVIDNYVKSKKQYWKERNRRKQAYQLSSKGYTYKEIAAELRVSTKTVQRDLKKLSRYITGKINKSISQMQNERWEKLMAPLEGLNEFKRFHELTKILIKLEKQRRGREYKRHLLKLIIDMDDLKHGAFPTIKPWPSHKHFSITLPLHVQFILRANGENMKYGGFTIG